MKINLTGFLLVPELVGEPVCLDARAIRQAFVEPLSKASLLDFDNTEMRSGSK